MLLKYIHTTYTYTIELKNKKSNGKNPFPLDSDICSQIKDNLKIGHQNLCPWPQNPCPPSFLNMPSWSAQNWKFEINSAFHSLLELKSNLPELNEDTVASMVNLFFQLLFCFTFTSHFVCV